MDDYFRVLFHPFLSAYRKGYSCQSTLLALTEDWRQSLDGGHFVGAILMDLSKAFDCLPHRLLLEKLRAYNLAESAVSLLPVLSDREQCVKIGNAQSASLPMCKGVPQGSIIGPLLFNIFINDIFHFTHHTKLYNYADDNTISYSSPHLGSALVDWFAANQMEANPEKFQGIAVGKKAYDKKPTFNIQGADIECTDDVKLFGVTIDYRMNFDIFLICVKRRHAKLMDFTVLENICQSTAEKSFTRLLFYLLLTFVQ